MDAPSRIDDTKDIHEVGDEALLETMHKEKTLQIHLTAGLRQTLGPIYDVDRK